MWLLTEILQLAMKGSRGVTLFRLWRSAGLHRAQLVQSKHRDMSSWPSKSPQDTVSPLSLLLSHVCLSLSHSRLLFIHLSTHISLALSGALTPDEVQAYHSHVITTWLLQCYTPKPQKSGWQSIMETGKRSNEVKDRGIEEAKTEERGEECGIKERERERWRQCRII